VPTNSPNGVDEMAGDCAETSDEKSDATVTRETSARATAWKTELPDGKGFFFNSPPFKEVVGNMITEAGSSRARPLDCTDENWSARGCQEDRFRVWYERKDTRLK